MGHLLGPHLRRPCTPTVSSQGSVAAEIFVLLFAAIALPVTCLSHCDRSPSLASSSLRLLSCFNSCCCLLSHQPDKMFSAHSMDLKEPVFSVKPSWSLRIPAVPFLSHPQPCSHFVWRVCCHTLLCDVLSGCRQPGLSPVRS